MTSKPSYRALKAFVETVHAGSMAAAGRRLGVSASAVSHLIRELEQQLDTRLFLGGSKSLLTEAGQRLERSVGASFVSIDRALVDLSTSGSEVRLSTVATFASLWLLPRLQDFSKRYPDTRLTVSNHRRVVRLGAEPFDCSVRWGRGGWPDAESRLLFNEELILVGSPALLKGVEALTLPRIAALTRPDDWPAYLQAAHGKDFLPTLIVEDRAAAAQAAAAGLGVTVVDRTLASQAIRSGALAPASEARCRLQDGFHFVSSPTCLSKDSVATFGAWMTELVQREATAPPPHPDDN